MAKKLFLLILVLCLLVGCERYTARPTFEPSPPGGTISTAPRVSSQPNTKRTSTPCPTSVPCPTCPPPPTPTPTPSIGDRAAPIPFGVRFMLVADEHKAFLFSLTESYRGEEAWARILEANQFNDPPPEGMEYLLLYGVVEYLSGPADEALRLSPWAFRIVSQNQVLNPPAVVEPEPKLDIEFFPVANGGGWMAWTIFQEDEAPLLVNGLEYDGSGGAYFATAP